MGKQHVELNVLTQCVQMVNMHIFQDAQENATQNKTTVHWKRKNKEYIISAKTILINFLKNVTVKQCSDMPIYQNIYEMIKNTLLKFTKKLIQTITSY